MEHGLAAVLIADVAGYSLCLLVQKAPLRVLQLADYQFIFGLLQERCWRVSVRAKPVEN